MATQGNSIDTVQRTLQRKRFRGQRGATLLEAIAFLGIAAIVLVGAISLFSNAFQGARSNQLNEEVGALESAIRKVYSQGAGLSTNLKGGVAGLVAAGVMPATLTVNGTGTTATVTDEWGGDVTVSWDSTTSAAQIAFNNVPESVCIAAVTAGGDWSQVTTDSSSDALTYPVSTQTATTACGKSSNTITWEFNS